MASAPMRIRLSTIVAGAAVFLTPSFATRANAQSRTAAAVVDQLFPPSSRVDRPGCAIGIDRAGEPRVTRAFGAADLEYDIAANPETIYEAGSISKQFTAASVMLLAIEGKLNVTDDVRKYVPELPAYERPITIELLLHHTSGIRDWGEIAAIGGWPRGLRAHTNEHALEIIARQKVLNYPPGDKYSYTNSGYNLLAIIVGRVSGKSLAQFSRERLFVPLGMKNTSWRDDFTRVVKGRAQAYSPRDSGWSLDMPFENAYGNGGLLTTVSDQLTWMQNLEHPKSEFKAMVDSLHVQGKLTDGTTITYARGIIIDTYRNAPRVEHSGSTAGYRTFAAHFPGNGLAIAVLCNAANANPTSMVNQLVDSLLASKLGARVAAANPKAPPRVQANVWKPDAAQLAQFGGRFTSEEADATVELKVEGNQLWLLQKPAVRRPLVVVAKDSFTVAGAGTRIWFTRDGQGKVNALHTFSSRAYDVVFGRQ